MVKDKVYKLDLFNDLLPAMDRRDFKFYSDLSDEEKKGFAAITALRVISGYSDVNQDMCEYFIEMSNEANKHLWNPVIAKNHPELQYLTLALIGMGKKVRHEWIRSMSGKKKTNKVFDILRKYDPTANNEELQMLFDINDIDELIEIAKMIGTQDDVLKDFKKEVKKLKK